MTKIALSALSLALCVSVAAFAWQSRINASLTAENASLTRSIAVLEEDAAQSRQAAEVAKANAAREKIQADEYDTMRLALIKGDEDAELPQWFVDYIAELLGGL